MATTDTCRDLSWLLQRCGQRLRAATDAIAVQQGLRGGLRDYIVLRILEVEQPRNQSELARLVGLDKTTLTGVLDRAEEDGLVERQIDPKNRRIRRPVLTPEGKRVQHAITEARHAVEVPGMSASDLQTLTRLLTQLDAACDEAGLTISGSCV